MTRIHRDNSPKALIVTEGVVAFDDYWSCKGGIHDQRRVDYLREHFHTAAQIICQCAHKGYVFWTLLDNFEWSEGYRKRFGRGYVDYLTWRCIIKNSGR